MYPPKDSGETITSASARPPCATQSRHSVRGDRQGSLNTLAAAERGLDSGYQQIQCRDNCGPLAGEFRDGRAEFPGCDAGELRRDQQVITVVHSDGRIQRLHDGSACSCRRGCERNDNPCAEPVEKIRLNVEQQRESSFRLGVAVAVH